MTERPQISALDHPLRYKSQDEAMENVPNTPWLPFVAGPVDSPCEVGLRHTDIDGSTATVVLEGYLCTPSVEELLGPTQQMMASVTAGTVIADLSGVQFVDGRGISLLVSLCLHARERSLGMRLDQPSSSAARLLDICNLSWLTRSDRPRHLDAEHGSGLDSGTG